MSFFLNKFLQYFLLLRQLLQRFVLHKEIAFLKCKDHYFLVLRGENIHLDWSIIRALLFSFCSARVVEVMQLQVIVASRPHIHTVGLHGGFQPGAHCAEACVCLPGFSALLILKVLHISNQLKELMHVLQKIIIAFQKL